METLPERPDHVPEPPCEVLSCRRTLSVGSARGPWDLGDRPERVEHGVVDAPQVVVRELLLQDLRKDEFDEKTC